jgi:hypothetical protein
MQKAHPTPGFGTRRLRRWNPAGERQFPDFFYGIPGLTGRKMPTVSSVGNSQGRAGGSPKSEISWRIAAVDEDLGIVLMRLDFGETASYAPGKSLVVWEEFKIYGGVIHAVEAFMRYMPSHKESGWK